jgi:hypothetical protein
MTLIPQQILSSWSAGMRQSDALKIKCICEARDVIKKNKGEATVGQLQKEIADAFGCPQTTLRDYLSIVRDFDMEVLYHYLERGLSMHHFELAGQYRPQSPQSLLDDAINLGNEIGRVMTCKEMVQFALGEKPQTKPMFHLNNLLSRFPKFVNRLPLDKQDKARELCREFEDGMRKLFEEER